MNSINNTINGLASSLLLSVGLTTVAEKLDPVLNRGNQSTTALTSAQACETCITLCSFTPEAGQ